MNKSINPAAMTELSLSDLYAILDNSFEPDSSVDINTVLFALEQIEKRIGKSASPQLDAAWETIKHKYLL